MADFSTRSLDEYKRIISTSRKQGWTVSEFVDLATLLRNAARFVGSETNRVLQAATAKVERDLGQMPVQDILRSEFCRSGDEADQGQEVEEPSLFPEETPPSPSRESALTDGEPPFVIIEQLPDGSMGLKSNSRSRALQLGIVEIAHAILRADVIQSTMRSDIRGQRREGGEDGE